LLDFSARIKLVRKIVILGAGFGGLRAALRLGRFIKKHQFDDQYDLTLVDRNGYHTYTPTLYEIATTPQSVANHIDLKSITTFPIKEIVKNLPVRFVQSEITEINILAKEVRLIDERLAFDYLILAIGVEPDFHNIPGLRENALPFKTFLDSIRLRDQLSIVAVAEATPHILIGGGGATGVELAGELKMRLPGAKVTIIESGDSILKTFDETMIARAKKRLEKLGVDYLENAQIISADPSAITIKMTKTNDRRPIPYDLIIWSGGNRGAAVVEPLPVSKDRSQPLVEPGLNCIPAGVDLSVTDNVYGVGDVACFLDPKTGRRAPAVARAAIIQADLAAKNIISEILSYEGLSERRKSYFYKIADYPYVLPIGGKFAIAKIGPIHLGGFLGWLFKGLIELNYLFSIMPNWLAFKIWLKGLKIFGTNKSLG